MRERLISAAVLVPVVIAVFLLGQPWLTLGLAAVAGLAALEVARLLVGAGFPVEPGILVVAAPLAVLGMGWADAPVDAVPVFVAAVIVIAAIDAFRRPEARDGYLAWMATSFGALYAALLAFMAGILVIAPAVPAGAAFANILDAGRVWLLVLVLSVWSFDTFAYLAGRTFKRGHFLNHISPNKTWSGVIGGTLAAIVVAGALTWAAGQNVLGGLLLGLLVAITAQSGDVAESLLKRAAGAKDSGSLIPGHGGVLDRVDSFLFAAPAVFAYLVVLGRLGSPA